MLSADLMGHFEGTLEAQNADSRGLVIRFLEATQFRNRLSSLFVSYYGKKKKNLVEFCLCFENLIEKEFKSNGLYCLMEGVSSQVASGL